MLDTKYDTIPISRKMCTWLTRWCKVPLRCRLHLFVRNGYDQNLYCASLYHNLSKSTVSDDVLVSHHSNCWGCHWLRSCQSSNMSADRIQLGQDDRRELYEPKRSLSVPGCSQFGHRCHGCGTSLSSRMAVTNASRQQNHD